MIPRGQINLRKPLGSFELIQQIIYSGQRVLVLHSNHVQPSIVNTQTHATIHLFHKEDWCTPRGDTWSYEPLVQQFFQLLLWLGHLGRSHSIRTLGQQSCPWF
ncbi:hypothetical protein YC2023_108030 [Brassica napus]